MTLLRKSISKVLRRAKEGVTQFTKRSKTLPLFSMVFLTLATTPITSASSIVTETSQPVSDFRLDIKSTEIISANRVISVITIGESSVDRDARVKAEQEAAAVAAAKAKADAARNAIAREKRVYNDPTDFDLIYAQAENAMGVDRKLLKAIHIVETGASGSTNRSSYAGAVGPMQFLPSTFRRHAVDGNGDGIKDITNVNDAIFSAAQYLKDCGYPNVKKALWGYNPSNSYYNKVMRIYNGL